MKRKIAAITTSRADYCHLYWPLRELAAHPEIELEIIAMGPHLSPEFGCPAAELEQDGFRISERIECLLSSDTDVGMAKTIGVAALGLADCLGRMRPDVLVLIADRFEMLAPAAVATALRIPLAHIEGGEISEGAIDDAIRNALTKLSHVHFTSTEMARRRVIAMGEEAWRVHRAGAPSLDHLRRSELWSREQVECELGVRLQSPAMVVGFHPTTMARDTTREADALFAALECVRGQILFCYPNADAGSRALIERARSFCARRADSRVFINLNPVLYWSLLRWVDLLVGNSSSGIMEAASLALPAVDIGIRQRGRERGRNVLNAEAQADAILDRISVAMDAGFRRSLEGMENPYGDGHAAERIAATLASIPLGEDLLIKRAPELEAR
jgi:UDP-hydrolysing UDP-N-acetyl-D-glucosamine 2-epimerase